MTDKPTPTDAELKAMWQLHAADIGGVFHYARAVLAKWGTPAPVEPIGYLYCGGSYGDELADWEIVADQHQCDKLNEHHGSLGKEEKLPIYTTPQPTQTQAGAVPLTDEQIDALLWKYGYDPDNEHMAAMLKEVHGIKGGQHGTVTPERIKDEASHHGFIGSTEMLVRFSRAIEAEVRKDDEALIRQLVAALEGEK